MEIKTSKAIDDMRDALKYVDNGTNSSRKDEIKSSFDYIEEKLTNTDGDKILELQESIQKEMESCKRNIAKIDIEMARLHGKREELDDRKTMLFGLLNKNLWEALNE